MSDNDKPNGEMRYYFWVPKKAARERDWTRATPGCMPPKIKKDWWLEDDGERWDLTSRVPKRVREQWANVPQLAFKDTRALFDHLRGEISVNWLDLPTATHRALLRSEIRTIPQLVEFCLSGKIWYVPIRNLGRKGQVAIVLCLIERGLISGDEALSVLLGMAKSS